MTEKEIIEILNRHCTLINKDYNEYIIKNKKSFASEILVLHNDEIRQRDEIIKASFDRLAKYKELVEAWETLSDMQTDDFEQGTYYTNQITRNELRRKIDKLEKDIV